MTGLLPAGPDLWSESFTLNQTVLFSTDSPCHGIYTCGIRLLTAVAITADS